MGRSASRNGGLFRASILSLVLICIGHGSAEGEFIKVPDDAATIQAGITQAAAGDTVAVRWKGALDSVYVERVVIDKEIKVLGGWDQTFSTRDPSLYRVVIDAQATGTDAGQPVRFATGLTRETVLDGFTLTNGLSPQTTKLLGGGIYCSDTSPTISNNSIRDNRANFGSGIACVDGADPLIENNYVYKNVEIVTSGEAGVGIFCRDSSPIIRNNRIISNKGSGVRCERSAPLIENNVFIGNVNGAGLACLERSAATVRYNTFTENRASFGGAIWIKDSSPVIEYNEIRENQLDVSAEQGGGAGIAVLTRTIPPDSAKPVIRHNIFELNNANTEAGAILVRNFAYAQIDSNLFKSNAAQGVSSTSDPGPLGGGAIVVRDNARADIRNNTFFANSAPTGGTIYIRHNAEVLLERNIIFGSSMGSGISVRSSVQPTLSCNCVSNNLPADYVGTSPGATDIQLNPIFCSTDTDTLDLASNSPCLPANSPCGRLIGAFGEGICSSYPTNFDLLSPDDDARINIATPTFIWESSSDPDAGVVTFEFEYDVDPTFDTSQRIQTGSDTSYTFQSSEALVEGVTYYWHAIATDSQGNTTTSNQIHQLLYDKTPPRVTVGIHQHPYLDSYLDLYIVVGEDIQGELAAALTLEGSPEDLDLELLDPDERLYYSPYEMTSSGDAIISAEATDLAGNVTARADTFSIEVIRPGAEATFASPDGALAVSVEKGTFAGPAYFLVRGLGREVETFTASASEGGDDATGRIYSVTWAPSGPAHPVKLTFRGSEDASDNGTCAYRWDGRDWETVPTYRDPDSGEFYALTSKPGRFQLRTDPGAGRAVRSALFQNFPNPFRGATTVAFRIGGEGGTRAVSIKVFDVKGRLVKNLLDADLSPGPYTATWGGTNSSGSACPSGLYLYRLNIEGEGPKARKMILTR